MTKLFKNDAIRRAQDKAARTVIIEALRAGGDVASAAAKLDVTRETLQRWCSRLGIDVYKETGRTRPKHLKT